MGRGSGALRPSGLVVGAPKKHRNNTGTTGQETLCAGLGRRRETERTVAQPCQGAVLGAKRTLKITWSEAVVAKILVHNLGCDWMR
jgi:hypothetical protein